MIGLSVCARERVTYIPFTTIHPVCSSSTNVPCGSNAQCVFDPEQSFTCQCRSGYEGDPLQGCSGQPKCLFAVYTMTFI